jgi:hypothetical protein
MHLDLPMRRGMQRDPFASTRCEHPADPCMVSRIDGKVDRLSTVKLHKHEMDRFGNACLGFEYGKAWATARAAACQRLMSSKGSKFGTLVQPCFVGVGLLRIVHQAEPVLIRWPGTRSQSAIDWHGLRRFFSQSGDQYKFSSRLPSSDTQAPGKPMAQRLKRTESKQRYSQQGMSLVQGSWHEPAAKG